MIGGEIETLVQATYRWVLDQSGVSLALSGAKDLREMEDPVSASSLSPLGPNIHKETESLHKKDFGAA
jgi:aryl-alcohol dehydrogenase-like predicted oxidoreductase